MYNNVVHAGIFSMKEFHASMNYQEITLFTINSRALRCSFRCHNWDTLAKRLDAFRGTAKGSAYMAIVGNKDETETTVAVKELLDTAVDRLPPLRQLPLHHRRHWI
jgi:hypothetical protein